MSVSRDLHAPSALFTLLSLMESAKGGDLGMDCGDEIFSKWKAGLGRWIRRCNGMASHGFLTGYRNGEIFLSLSLRMQVGYWDFHRRFY